jgi:hypothetical protein
MIKRISLFLIIILPYIGLAQDGSLIANTKTSNIDFKIKPSFTGLWEVRSVTVGEKSMTPVAKWFQINEDGTAFGGNGWLQNVESNWEFNETSNELLFVTDGLPDEYGGFVLNLNDNVMTWSRIEEGQKVEVHLELTESKPLAPWDKIVGIWKWIGMENQNIETHEIKIATVEPDWTRIRWDRRYDTFDVVGKRTESGIWHFDAHQPILTIFDSKDEKFEWKVEFLNDQMIWTQNTEKEILKLTFEKSEIIGTGN